MLGYGPLYWTCNASYVVAATLYFVLWSKLPLKLQSFANFYEFIVVNFIFFEHNPEYSQLCCVRRVIEFESIRIQIIGFIL